MATKIPTPVIHIYKEVNNGKYKSVKHFELVTTQNNNPVLPNKINISKDRNFAKSSPQYWLKIWNGKNGAIGLHDYSRLMFDLHIGVIQTKDKTSSFLNFQMMQRH